MGGLYIALAVFFALGLNYNFMRSDVLSYWQASFAWRTPFNEHPPLYSLTIALLRTLTFNLLPPTILMMGINLAAFLISLYLVVQIAKAANLTPSTAAAMAVAFGLWPFVGLTYTVVPLADLPAIALTLAGLLMLQKDKPIHSGIFFGLALVTHKGVWPIVAFVFIAYVLSQKPWLSRKNILALVVLLTPLVVLWVGGIFYHGRLNWFMERSLVVNTTMDGGFPVFGGLIGTFQAGGLRGWVKGSLALFFTVLALVTLIFSLRLKFRFYPLAAALSLGVLTLFVFSSTYTIWGPVRFSRFLSIPLWLILDAYFPEKEGQHGLSKTSLILGAVLLLTQFVYAWYTVKVFFA